MLNEGLPHYELTLALGAWKFAHWRLPARQIMGVQRLVAIGIEKVAGAAWVVDKPKISAPAVDAHKYTRGLCAVVAGRSEEHTSELQSLMRISYAVFCLKKKTIKHITSKQHEHDDILI